MGDKGHRLSHCPTSTPQPHDSTHPGLDQGERGAREPEVALRPMGDPTAPTHATTQTLTQLCWGPGSPTLPLRPRDLPPPSPLTCPGKVARVSHLCHQHPRVLAWPWRAGAPRKPGAGCVLPARPSPSLWLRLKLCPARRLVITRVPGLWQDALHARDLLWHCILSPSPQPQIPPHCQPQGPPGTGRGAQERHSHFCFNKTRKGGKKKRI